jgi:hypothetical protein
MLKVIVAGSRDFSDYELLKSQLDLIFGDCAIEIVSGAAKGADRLGEKYAKEKGYLVTRFAAYWNRYRKAAGYKRNEQMAKYATHAVIFWNGFSLGTKNMIDLANQHGLNYQVIQV